MTSGRADAGNAPESGVGGDVSGDAARPDAPRPDAPPAPLPGSELPRSTFLWLALLVLSFVVSALLDRPDTGPVSAGSFTAVAQAEAVIRSAFALGDGPTGRDRALDPAVKTYRALLRKPHGPQTPRKVLILEHAQGKPLDDGIVTRDLPAALKSVGVAPTEIAAEQRLWRSLYGPARGLAPGETAAALERTRALRLGFLEGVVLADVYRAAGDRDASARQADANRAAALRHALTQGALVLGGLLVFVVGVCLWLWVLTNAAGGRWQAVGFAPGVTPRDALSPRLGFGVLVDAFVAYLTLTKLLGVVAGVALPALLPEPSRQAEVVLTALVYGTPAVAALLYLNASLRRHGVGWEAVGVGVGVGDAGTGRQARYALLAWCASVPLTLALGYLARTVLNPGGDLAPNPVLPLTAGGTDPLSRAILFLLAVVAAPLVEETFFRGALLTGLRARYGPVAAVLLSAVAFAVVHPRADWLPIFGLGLVLGGVRVARENLLACVVVHTLQNGFAFLMLTTLFSA